MNYADVPDSPKPIVDILDAYTQGRDQPGVEGQLDAKGLFWILDEESMFPGATDVTFLERVLMHHSDSGTGAAVFTRDHLTEYYCYMLCLRLFECNIWIFCDVVLCLLS